MWKRIIAFILLVSISLAGCSNVVSPVDGTEFGSSLYEENIENGVEMEDFSDNLDIEYIRWAYNGFQYSEATRTSWHDPHNLTETPEGYVVLQSFEEYDALLRGIKEKRQLVISQLGSYAAPKVLVDTMECKIDESFFEEHNLVVVDYNKDGSPFLRTRLDQVENGEKANITISVEFVLGSTADCPGEVYWIPIPKTCTQAEITYVHTAWNRT